MRKKVTLKQLAEELNLSISTVSKSLKDDSEISQKTIDKVKALAKKHNYKPNALAVSLKSNKTKSIGVIIPDILNPFFAKALLGIEKEASKEILIGSKGFLKVKSFWAFLVKYLIPFLIFIMFITLFI